MKRIAVCGGVASNKRLREKLREEAAEQGVSLYIPSPSFCTDNAAMIAVAGYYILCQGVKQQAALAMNAFSRLPGG